MTEETPVRRRILDAAFSTFIEAGYAATTMLEIARRARVSKRELYAVVGNKQDMLVTCIRERSRRLRPPLRYDHTHNQLQYVLQDHLRSYRGSYLSRQLRYQPHT